MFSAQSLSLTIVGALTGAGFLFFNNPSDDLNSGDATAVAKERNLAFKNVDVCPVPKLSLQDMDPIERAPMVEDIERLIEKVQMVENNKIKDEADFEKEKTDFGKVHQEAKVFVDVLDENDAAQRLSLGKWLLFIDCEFGRSSERDAATWAQLMDELPVSYVGAKQDIHLTHLKASEHIELIYNLHVDRYPDFLMIEDGAIRGRCIEGASVEQLISYAKADWSQLTNVPIPLIFESQTDNYNSILRSIMIADRKATMKILFILNYILVENAICLALIRLLLISGAIYWAVKTIKARLSPDAEKEEDFDESMFNIPEEKKEEKPEEREQVDADDDKASQSGRTFKSYEYTTGSMSASDLMDNRTRYLPNFYEYQNYPSYQPSVASQGRSTRSHNTHGRDPDVF